MKRRFLSLLAVCTLLFVGLGCIEFERQVMTYRYDRASDSLLIFQDYQGIYGGDNPAKLAGIEASQFQSVLSGGRTFFFANWIFEINLKTLRDLIVDLPDKPSDTVAEDEFNLASLAAAKIFAANCKIENGNLYLNKQGRLSGTQQVKISNLREILPALEEVLKAYFKAEAGKALADHDRQAAVDTMSRAGWKFIELTGNRIILRLPMSEAEYLSSFNKGTEQEFFRKLKAAGISVRHSKGILTVSMGREADDVTRISFSPFTKGYRNNLLKHLHAKDTMEIRKSFNSDQAARKFLEAEPK